MYVIQTVIFQCTIQVYKFGFENREALLRNSNIIKNLLGCFVVLPWSKTILCLFFFNELDTIVVVLHISNFNE